MRTYVIATIAIAFLHLTLFSCSACAEASSLESGPYIPDFFLGVYNFRNSIWTSGKTQDLWIHFAANSTDLHIVFSPDRSFANAAADTINRYEIVIAAWYNTKSVIRRHLQGEAFATDLVTGRCSPGVWRTFWARYSNGLVTVGSGDFGDNTFMTFLDPNPLSAPYFDFSQWNIVIAYDDVKWGDSSNLPTGGSCLQGRFFPCFPKSEGVPYVPQFLTGRYTFPNSAWRSGRSQDIWVQFSANCSSDIHIVFSPDRSFAPAAFDPIDRYEIVITGWFDSKSVIRRHLQGSPYAIDYVSGRCTPGKLEPFWASYLNGVISVGNGSVVGQSTFMSWTDPDPLDTPYFDFGQWDYHVQYFDVKWGQSSDLPGPEPGPTLPGSDSGLSPGATAGVVLGCVAAVAVIIAVVLATMRRRQQSQGVSQDSVSGNQVPLEGSNYLAPPAAAIQVPVEMQAAPVPDLQHVRLLEGVQQSSESM